MSVLLLSYGIGPLRVCNWVEASTLAGISSASHSASVDVATQAFCGAVDSVARVVLSSKARSVEDRAELS